MVYADEILDYSGQRKTGVTAGSYGPSTDASPEAGGTIAVPQLTVNENGLITGAVERTVTLPSGGGGGGGGGEEQFQIVYETTLTEAAEQVVITSTDMGGVYVDVIVCVAPKSISDTGSLMITLQAGSMPFTVLSSVSSGVSMIVGGVMSNSGLVYLTKTVVGTSGPTMESAFFPTVYPAEIAPYISQVSLDMIIGGQVTAFSSGTSVIVYARRKVTANG